MSHRLGGRRPGNGILRVAWDGSGTGDARYRRRGARRRGSQVPAAVRFLSCEPLLGPLPSLDVQGIDWVIAGGESGPRHRPLDEAWVTGIRDLCQEADVAFFFKQWGGRTPKAGGRELDGRTWSEMPQAAAAV